MNCIFGSVSSSKILAELEKALTPSKRIDYITLSGSGEPTLNSKAGGIIKEIKQMTTIPVAVLTNGTLLTNEMLRKELISEDISSSLGLHINEVIKYVQSLEKEGKITSKIHQGKRYFSL